MKYPAGIVKALSCGLLVLAGNSGAIQGSIINECSIHHGDGTTSPCEASNVAYGSMNWGAVIPPTDEFAEAHIGYSQNLTFSGPDDGTAGYIGIYAYDFFIQASASSATIMSFVDSNLPLLRTLDDTQCMECQGIPLPMIPITFGTPINLTVSEHAVALSSSGENQYAATYFRILQIYVFDSHQNLLVQLETPTTENANVLVPTPATDMPEPATLGITGAAMLVFLTKHSRRCKKALD